METADTRPLPQPYSLLFLDGCGQHHFGYHDLHIAFSHAANDQSKPQAETRPLCDLWSRILVGRSSLFALPLLTIYPSACAASVVRLPYLLILNHSDDYMYGQWGILIWSCVELNLGIACACIPTLKALLRKLRPGSSTGGSSGDTGSSKAKGSQTIESGTHQLRSLQAEQVDGERNDQTPDIEAQLNSSQEMIVNPPKNAIMTKTDISVRRGSLSGQSSLGLVTSSVF